MKSIDFNTQQQKEILHDHVFRAHQIKDPKISRAVTRAAALVNLVTFSVSMGIMLQGKSGGIANILLGISTIMFIPCIFAVAGTIGAPSPHFSNKKDDIQEQFKKELKILQAKFSGKNIKSLLKDFESHIKYKERLSTSEKVLKKHFEETKKGHFPPSLTALAWAKIIIKTEKRSDESKMLDKLIHDVKKNIQLGKVSPLKSELLKNLKECRKHRKFLSEKAVEDIYADIKKIGKGIKSLNAITMGENIKSVAIADLKTENPYTTNILTEIKTLTIEFQEYFDYKGLSKKVQTLKDSFKQAKGNLPPLKTLINAKQIIENSIKSSQSTEVSGNEDDLKKELPNTETLLKEIEVHINEFHKHIKSKDRLSGSEEALLKHLKDVKQGSSYLSLSDLLLAKQLIDDRPSSPIAYKKNFISTLPFPEKSQKFVYRANVCSLICLVSLGLCLSSLLPVFRKYAEYSLGLGLPIAMASFIIQALARLSAHGDQEVLMLQIKTSYYDYQPQTENEQNMEVDEKNEPPKEISGIEAKYENNPTSDIDIEKEKKGIKKFLIQHDIPYLPATKQGSSQILFLYRVSCLELSPGKDLFKKALLKLYREEKKPISNAEKLGWLL